MCISSTTSDNHGDILVTSSSFFSSALSFDVKCSVFLREFRETVFRNMADDSADDSAAYVEYLHRKLLTAIFLYYDIKSA
jgi:hypothetical protein